MPLVLICHLPGKTLPGPVGLTLGVLLSIWIIIQVTWITMSSFLQPLFLIIGAADIFLGWKILKYKLKVV